MFQEDPVRRLWVCLVDYNRERRNDAIDDNSVDDHIAMPVDFFGAISHRSRFCTERL
jgi:hypothetical protein